MTPVGTLADGTQIWKITHNGVDTHAIHFHMFNVQVINRVGWDGAIRPPDPNELGWKDTVRMNPLEDVIVALRPIIPIASIPDSQQHPACWMSTHADWLHHGVLRPGPMRTTRSPSLNQLVNFGWEYVWHCHLLGHEENDMMRPMIIAVPPEAPSNLAAAGLSGPFRIRLTWNDNSLNATGFTVQRATDPAFTLNLTTFTVVKAAGIPQTYIDTTAVNGTLYYYRVLAIDQVGGITGVPTEPSMTATSAPSNVVKHPTNLHYLTVISPHGTVVKNPDQPSYINGDIDLTATAFSGWTFTNWTGNVPSSPNSANPVTVTVGSSDLTVIANYLPVNPTISGNAGVAGATLSYTDGTPKTATADGSGNYSFTVSPGWTGSVTPSKTGYSFSPASRPYSNVRANQSAQNYTATLITYTISGNTGVGGVTLSYTDGTPKLVNSNAGGVYSITVPYHWTGTVTPSKTGYTFLPANLSYTNVSANQTAQNYTATPITFTISGNAGVAGATLSYTDGTPKTATADGSGNYSFSVLYNWSGTVTPSFPGYSFTPVNRVYPPVLANQTAQDYTATLTPSPSPAMPGWLV